MSAISQAAKSAPPTGKNTVSPSQTLYISNLPDRLQKEDLKRSLYGLFATYGHVLDIVALKTTKMRGQAHVVYRDTQTSTQAMRSLQGFEFFGKEMHISYAKGKSDIISRLDGSARVPDSKVPTAERTEVQKSVFNNPNMPLPSKPLPTAATANNLSAPNEAVQDGSKSPQGLKRARQDESDEDDASMDEDDEGEAMEESDDD